MYVSYALAYVYIPSYMSLPTILTLSSPKS